MKTVRFLMLLSGAIFLLMVGFGLAQLTDLKPVKAKAETTLAPSAATTGGVSSPAIPTFADIVEKAYPAV
ncbi:MAG: hypothetical protein N2445_08195, partial [Acidobacteria bacterium]|nr:hypothetical protein [Acidobacteriota bacterium]